MRWLYTTIVIALAAWSCCIRASTWWDWSKVLPIDCCNMLGQAGSATAESCGGVAQLLPSGSAGVLVHPAELKGTLQRCAATAPSEEA